MSTCLADVAIQRDGTTTVASPGIYPHLAGEDPNAVPGDPATSYASLRDRVQNAANQQLEVADMLKGDMKYWFAKVYYFVTSNILDTADAGSFMYPHAVFQEALAFHATYMQNLTAWRAGEVAKVESNWKVAFKEAENVNDGSWYRTRAQQILSALLPSMEAHIRFDLPRAIASVYESNYANKPGVTVETFRADFDRMGPIFDKANKEISVEIEKECSIADPGDWHWLQTIGFPFIFNIAMERQHSFEKADWISSAHQTGVKDQAGMENRMESSTSAAHPFSGSDDYSISTSWGSGDWAAKKVEDYDWSSQPQ